MSEASLKKTALTSVVWTTIQRFSSVIIGFVSSIILARLLSPEDYGCIGMLSIFMVIASAFIEGGFGSALIQKKRPTREDYTTVFYWNLIVSVFCYTILYFTAPYIAKYYRMSLLCAVLRAQGIVLIINALKTVHINQMYKQFRFKKLAIIDLITSFISLPITIWMAYRGYGVWALVIQTILINAIPTIIYWATDNWWPLLSFSTKSFNELFSFGFYILISSLVTQTVDNIQGILIGRIYNPSRMGYYSKAQSTQQLATQTITQVVSQVTYPLFSEIQDDKSRLIGVIKRLNSVLALLIFPLVFLLILLAKTIFIILYSEKWIECVPYFQILCFSGITLCLQSSTSQAIKSIGLIKVMFKWDFINNLCGITLVIFGLLLLGIKGMLIGMVLRSWVAYFINVWLLSKHLGYKVRRQLLDLLPMLLFSIVSFGTAYVLVLLFNLNMYSATIIQFIIFVTTYTVCIRTLKIEAFETLLDIIQPILRKVRHLRKY